MGVGERRKNQINRTSGTRTRGRGKLDRLCFGQNGKGKEHRNTVPREKEKGGSRFNK